MTRSDGETTERKGDTMTDTEKDAIRGPWVAAMLTVAGLHTRDFDAVSVIRVARQGHETGVAFYPGSVLPDDVLYEIAEFGDGDEVIARWAQARSVADALNNVSGGGWYRMGFDAGFEAGASTRAKQ